MRTRRHPLRLPAAALLLLLPATAPSVRGEEQAAGVAVPGDRLRLIVDHLPPFLYTGEKLSFSFRIERAPALEEEIPFSVEWSFMGERDGKPLSSGGHQGRATERFTIVSGALSVPDVARRLRYSLTSGGRTLASGSARLVGEDAEWPNGARAVWGGMSAADGEALILTLDERVARVDNRWKPLRWVWKRGQARAESVIVAGPRLAAAEDGSYPELLKKSAERFAYVELSEDGRDAAPSSGIYRMVELVENELAARVKRDDADVVVLVMPQSDPEMAVEPRRYRQGLEWLLSRLRRAGAEHVALVPPLTRAVPARQTEAYSEACRQAAQTYSQTSGARCLDAEALGDAGLWRPEGASGAVTGRFPNAKGHAALAELIRAAYR